MQVASIPLLYANKSRLYIYILVAGFTRKSEVNMHTEQLSQLDILRRILSLLDLHSANYGTDGKGNLCIVDFQVFLNSFLLTLFISDIIKKNSSISIKDSP